LKYLFIILQIAFLQLTINAQNLSGRWIGKTESRITMPSPKSINLELEKVDDTIYTGVLHINYKRDNFEHIKISAKLKLADSTFLMIEDSLISFKKSIFEESCLGKNYLKYTQNQKIQTLIGLWKDKAKGIFKCPTLQISFQRDIEIINKNYTDTRITDVQKVIDISRVESDSIKIDLYDNGVFDNDSVSVFLNGKIIVNKIQLKLTPQTFYVSLDKNIQINKISLEAINLGDIPPNTGYMTLKTKKNSYSALLTSTLNKNGTLEFQFKD
jgi:hypothetical protein